MKAILSVLIGVLTLSVITLPAVGQTPDTSTSIAKKGQERYAPLFSHQQMTETKEYLEQFPDSINLSDLTVGDLRTVMGFVYSAAILDGREETRQAIRKYAVELPARDDTTTWRAYGLEPGKPYKGLLVTRLTTRIGDINLQRLEDNAQLSAELTHLDTLFSQQVDDLNKVVLNHDVRITDVETVVAEDDTPVVANGKKMAADDAAMKRIKNRVALARAMAAKAR